jgi:hypothetical protein
MIVLHIRADRGSRPFPGSARDRSDTGPRRSSTRRGPGRPGRRTTWRRRTLTAKIDSVASAQEEHAATLDGVAELRRQVERILALVEDDGEGSPTGWFWLTMTDQEREEKLAELYDWVETVLRPQHPAYLNESIKPCWPNHPEARWELTWLYQLWSRAYLAKRPMPRNVADWHDRWAPGVIRRLSYVMLQCRHICHKRAGTHNSGRAPRNSRQPRV